MKKVALCAVALLGFTTVLKAQGNFQLTKKGGGADGFDHVQQTTDIHGNTTMICTGAGQDKGKYETPPPEFPNPVDMNKIISFVDDQIARGKLWGTATVEGMLAKWEGSDVYNYTLTATQPKEKKSN